MFEEQALNPALHQRSAFDCGVPELNDYLQRLAVQHSKKGMAVVRVLVESSAPEQVLGYYTLSAAQVALSQLDERAQQKLPRYPVPCFRLGRFAVHADYQGQGLGKVLMGCAVARCLEARKQVAAYALLADAKNAAAKNFYEHYGFIACRDAPMTLYLPLGV